MIYYLCSNPGCLSNSHMMPYCPNRGPEVRSYTASERRAADHLWKLKSQGRISAPIPGSSSGWSWALPRMLPILLPAAIFLFFVVLLVFGSR
ncbi:hypothetical protein [Nocardia jejuensis]|uniref:hypothetical protein n=1 Tax=Nocardia jejuensis TaxID=328049 RepID=UPI00082B1188|nr:hypothetical protein [Nocardia jejuensis]